MPADKCVRETDSVVLCVYVCVWVFALKMRMQIDGQKALQKCPPNASDKSFN